MDRKYTVRILVDVDMEWSQESPRYRLFVEHEMFVERTWIWHNCYLEEALTVVAAAGKYMIRGELVRPTTASLTLTNWRVDHGPGRITDSGELEIFDETV
jgi:hypothetical protein